MARLDPLLKNRVALFWTLQLGGWLAYALSQYLGTLIYDTKYEHMTGYTTVIGVATISGFLLSLELRYIYNASGRVRRAFSSPSHCSVATFSRSSGA